MLVNLPLSQMPHWDLALIALWGVFGVIIEAIGLARRHGAVPITWVIRDLVPRWALAMIVGWLLYHFVVV